MARPLKTGLDYFSHDTEAVNDDKIQSLMALYGAEGYAFYFIMLERVFRTENGRITAGKPVEKAGLARAMCLTVKRFEQILETALEIGCFNKAAYTEESVITSNGIQKRLTKIQSEREKERSRKEQYLNTLKEKEKEKEKTGRGKLQFSGWKTNFDIDFNKFWTLYPERNGKKVGKGKTKELFCKLNGKADLILQAVKNYADSKQAKEGFAKDPERFLKNDFWQDWLEPEKKPTGDNLADRYKTL